jgi:hypothetical protein
MNEEANQSETMMSTSDLSTLASLIYLVFLILLGI